MRVAVAGGTGVVGQQVVAALVENGHDARVLSRGTGVDLLTGEGLDAALADIDAVVDASNVAALTQKGADRFFQTAGKNLRDAEQRAGVAHHVLISIVGIERTTGYGYYRAKLAQERLVSDSPIASTVVRATQFHDFPGQVLSRIPGPFSVVPRWQVQTVSSREVGALLAEVAVGKPREPLEIAGPEVSTFADLARRLLLAQGKKHPVGEFRLPGTLGRQVAGGGTIPNGPHLTGTETFDEWLVANVGIVNPG